MKKIKIVYLGTPAFSADLLQRLLQAAQSGSSFEITTVITNPDAPVGRDQTITASPVSDMATSYGLPLLKPEKINNLFLEEHASKLQADLYLVFAYGKILPQKLLSIPTLGCLNIHTSLLPKYRGAAPGQAAIFHGEKETGVTLMVMDEQMDHGPILAQKAFPIVPDDTAESVYTKMAELGTALFITSLEDFVGGKLKPQPQDESQATYTWKMNEMKEAGYFDINTPPSDEQLERMTRAFFPWPNAWTKWDGKVVKFYPNQIIQIEGKKKTSFQDFLLGYPGFPLKSLS